MKDDCYLNRCSTLWIAYLTTLTVQNLWCICVSVYLIYLILVNGLKLRLILLLSALMLVGHLTFIMGGWGFYVTATNQAEGEEFSANLDKFYFVVYLSIMGIKNWMSNWKMWRLSIMVED